MKETFGELWDLWGMPGFLICITTNGTVNRLGELVMGRGCARQAKERIPGLAKELARAVMAHGNVVMRHRASGIVTFPVKWHWEDRADLDLIKQSAMSLKKTALNDPGTTYVLPRPGCGNGRLDWETMVKPLLERVELPDNVWIISR